MAFEIYLNILEGIGLTAVEKDKSDAFVEVYAGALKKKVISTHVVQGSVNPKWRSEYCIQLPSLTEQLTFHIVHYNTIFKNVPMGESTMDLKSMTALEAGADVKLALKGGGGDLRVLVRAVPLAACDYSNHFVARPYAPFRLHLERFVYHPGELVSGNIIYNVQEKAKKVDWIHVEAIGKTHLDFRTPNGFGAPGHSDFIQKCFVSTFDYTWFSVRAVVAGQSSDGKGEKETFQIGTHLWAFDFTLPSRLPPTYTRQSFWSSYTLNVHVQVNGKVETVTKDIAIVPWLNGIRPTLTAPILSAVAAPSSGITTVTWNCPDIVVIGEPFNAKFEMTNMSDSAFVKVGVHLRTVRVYNIHVESKGWLANKFTEEICCAFLGSQCPAGATIGGEAVLLAQNSSTSMSCYPSVPDNMFADLIQVYHYLEVVGVKTDGVSRVSCGRYPVFVTYRQFLPPMGADFPPKLAAPNCTPGQFRVTRLHETHMMPLGIPLGPWIHPDYQLTQGRSMGVNAYTTNTSFVLNTELFEKSNAIVPLQAAALPSQVQMFPLGFATPLHIEHEEDATVAVQPRKADAGSVSINSNFGINLSYQPMSLGQLNAQLFGGGGR